jgi:hypothetical protein
MSIWIYGDTLADKDVVQSAVSQRKCIFCGTELDLLSHKKDTLDEGPGNTGVWAVDLARCCPTCGWWTTERKIDSNFGGMLTTHAYGAVGALKQLDISDQSISLEEIRAYFGRPI